MPPKNMVKFCRYLVIILLLLLVTVVTVLVIILIIHVKGNIIKDHVCTTDSCHSEATRMKSYMNEFEDPCDDFYSFACGGFKSQTKIEKHEPEVDQFTLLKDKTAAEIRLLLEEPISPSELKPFALAKVFYKSCTDTKTQERLKFQPLLKVLRGIGGWPVLFGNNWKPTETSIDDSGEWTWTRYSIWLVDVGLNSMPTFITVSFDKYVMINWPKLNLSPSILQKGMSLSLVRDYDRFMRYMVEVAGVYHSQARIEMQHTLNFEIKMAACMVKASDWLKDVPNDKSRIMTIQEMNNRYPSVQWIEFLQRMTGFAITLANETSIIVHNPVYLDCFINLVNSTDLRTLANYVGWRAALASAKYLNVYSAYSIESNHMNIISDFPYRPPRWQECVELIHKSMPEAVEAMYVRRYFNDDLIDPAYEMVKDIQNAFLDMLDENDWMSSVTKEEARDKAKSIQINTGYPEEYKDNPMNIFIRPECGF